ncbi:MAG: hypothetical protein RBR53_08070 [Desulforegulaceae bacterium]|nr:hypothetical protein [Desulforegulaceae bacterium]
MICLNVHPNIPKAETIKELKEKKAEEYKNMKVNVEEFSEQFEKI